MNIGLYLIRYNIIYNNILHKKYLNIIFTRIVIEFNLQDNIIIFDCHFFYVNIIT